MTKTQALKSDLATAKTTAPVLVIALCSGILMGATPAPLNLWGFAWVAIAPLWVLIGQRTDRKAHPLKGKKIDLKRLLGSWLLVPALWGLGYHGLALSWITGLHPLTWMGVPWLASLMIALFAWAFITAWGIALVCCWGGGMMLLEKVWRREWRWHPSTWRHLAGGKAPPGAIRSQAEAGSPTLVGTVPAWMRILVGTALWCGLETLWGSGPLYWTSVSYTQSPMNGAILHLGQISGSMTVSAAIVAVNGCLAEAWLARSAQRPHPELLVSSRPLSLGWSALGCFTVPPGSFYGGMALALVIACHGIGFTLATQPLGQPPETALKVGVIQGNVPTRIKLFPEGLRQAMNGYASGYRTLVDQGVDAVLTPEGAMPFIWQGDNRDRSPLYQAVKEKGVPLWLGTLVPQGNRLTQSLITITGNGDLLSRYNKVKLVPLGEYIPFSDVLGGLIGRLSPSKSDLLAGSPHQRFDTPFGLAAVEICYESAFPELLRPQVAAGAEFVLNAANLDPYSTILMAQHHAQDVMRAIETDRWIVRATNTGYSGVIDPHGRTEWLSKAQIYTTHAATIYRRQTQTLYTQWGNWLTPGLLGFSGLLLIGRVVKS
jgi:apolipoprotein N-acyltransferase